MDKYNTRLYRRSPIPLPYYTTNEKDSEIFPDSRVDPVQEPVTSQPESHIEETEQPENHIEETEQPENHIEETEQPETQGENETKYNWSTEGTGPIVDLCDIPPLKTRLDVHGQNFHHKPYYLSWHACILACILACMGMPGCYYVSGRRVGKFFKDKNACCKDSYTTMS